jgi:Flp pilus assembly pilin Flp
MKTFCSRLWSDQQGQDLIEYTLMLAFVALASAALFSSAGGSINVIWSTTDTQMSAAAAQAS